MAALRMKTDSYSGNYQQISLSLIDKIINVVDVDD